jgi:hypothetical protein
MNKPLSFYMEPVRFAAMHKRKKKKNAYSLSRQKFTVLYYAGTMSYHITPLNRQIEIFFAYSRRSARYCKQYHWLLLNRTKGDNGNLLLFLAGLQGTVLEILKGLLLYSIKKGRLSFYEHLGFAKARILL